MHFQNIFSSGKSLESVAFAMLYEKGLFEYDDKITKYWPEFGQNGKEDLRISDVCRHRCGLGHLAVTPSIEDTWTDNIKKNQMGSIIETLEPKHNNEKHGSKADYHAFSRGWITNEIIRRIDPKGRTMDEIFKEEVNIDGIHIKVDEKIKEILVPQTSITVAYTLIESMKPKWAGRRIEPSIVTIAKVFSKIL